MKLNSLLENRDDDLKAATSAWMDLLSHDASQGHQTDPVEVIHGEGRAAVRDWGHWENPPESEDEEDYDHQVMHRESVKKLEKMISDLLKTYPKFKFTFSTGEKNWLYIHVKTK